MKLSEGNKCTPQVIHCSRPPARLYIRTAPPVLHWWWHHHTASPWWRAVWAAGCSPLRWDGLRPGTSSWRRWRPRWSCGRPPRAEGWPGICPGGGTPAAGPSHDLTGGNHRDVMYFHWCIITTADLSEHLLKCCLSVQFWGSCALFYVTLHIFFTTFQREMLYILLHCSCGSLLINLLFTINRAFMKNGLRQ